VVFCPNSVVSGWEKLTGVKDNEFNISHGDSLTNEWGILRETNPAKAHLHFFCIFLKPKYTQEYL
jgi:type I restriction enzyme M protein